MWKAGAVCLLFNRWFISGILTKSTVLVEKSSMWRFMWRKWEFYGVIWRCFARVKCRNIMSGCGKCCDCRERHLLCDLPKVLTDKSQVCAVELVLLEDFVSSIKTLCLFTLGDFLLESLYLFCAQRFWILNLFSADTELWALRFDWLKDYNFWTFQMLFISSQNRVISARKIYLFIKNWIIW